MEVLLERVEVLEKSLEVQEEDVRQLSLQLEIKTSESRAREEELQLCITELQVHTHKHTIALMITNNQYKRVDVNL